MDVSLDDQILYKVVAAQDWEDACAEGIFSGVGIDLTDGFIHLSARHQVVETVRRYFANQDGLVLISVLSIELGNTLRWEPSRDGALFPHVYGDIQLGAVSAVNDLVMTEDGQHLFPESF